MANSHRIIRDTSGRVFVPMNVEGGGWNYNFITAGKLTWLVGIVVATFILVLNIVNEHRKLWVNALIIIGFIIIVTLVLRYIIFEEKFYYKMYKKMQKYEISTPGVFWNVNFINVTEDGAILTFADGKVGVCIKLERDTIIGKESEFEETHYDAVSDFYHAISDKKLRFVSANLLEPTENDPRMEEAEQLVSNIENKELKKLMQAEFGHIKNISRATLCESEYLLIYSTNIEKADTIMQEVCACASELINGAYIGFKILGYDEIVELMKQIDGVKSFNVTEAILNSCGTGLDSTINNSIKIVGLEMSSGEYLEVNDKERRILKTITSEERNSSSRVKTGTVQEALKKRNYNNSNSSGNSEEMENVVGKKIRKSREVRKKGSFGVKTDGALSSESDSIGSSRKLKDKEFVFDEKVMNDEDEEIDI